MKKVTFTAAMHGPDNTLAVSTTKQGGRSLQLQGVRDVRL